MRLEDEEADGHRGICLREFLVLSAEQLRQGDEIAQGFAHLLAVDRDHVVVDPVVDTLCVAAGHILGDLALVVREHQIHSAAVDVELVAEVFLAHHGAFQMPSRESLAPRTRPVHDVFRLGLLPKGEIVRSLLVALSVKCACSFTGVVQSAPGKDSVVVILVVFLHVKVHGSVGDVGVACVQNLLDGLDLLDDVSRGSRLDGWRRHVQQAHRLVVAERVGLHNLHRLKLFQPCLLGDLVLSLVGVVLKVSHVGDVPHVADLVAKMPEQFEKHIVGHSRTGVSEVSLSVDRRPADVHSHVSRLYRLEKLFRSSKSICQK